MDKVHVITPNRNNLNIYQTLYVSAEGRTLFIGISSDGSDQRLYVSTTSPDWTRAYDNPTSAQLLVIKQYLKRLGLLHAKVTRFIDQNIDV